MNKKMLLMLPVALLCLTGGSCDDKKTPTPPPAGPPPTNPKTPQYFIITAETKQIDFGVYEYRLLLDDPVKDRWVSVSQKQYKDCWLEPKAPTYPKCAGF